MIPRPWLPVLTGRMVESAQASDQFLWDLRKTIADLTADEHYGQVQASLKERGMGHYGESHESGRALIADGMEVKKLDDIPMSAMWVQKPGVNQAYLWLQRGRSRVCLRGTYLRPEHCRGRIHDFLRFNNRLGMVSRRHSSQPPIRSF